MMGDSSQPEAHPRVLVVDDDAAMREFVSTILEMESFEVQACSSADEAMDAVRRSDFDAVLTDVRMPGRDGIDFCREMSAQRPDTPVIVMTAFGSMESAVGALRAGAYDFVIKPFENDLLIAAVRRAATHSRLVNQLRVLQSEETGSSLGRMLGRSAPMQALARQLPPIAASDAPVLITGESGTGKELVARTIHETSDRASGPFVAVNCAALSETLLESELFGHTRGAFTDARENRDGLFVAAEGGTLLLDEMGDMPLPLQVKLLRALEEHRVRPVGSTREVEFDVRVLAATHRDLDSAVEDGEFRSDLFYRINVINVHLPPLRARGADILMIANHFIEQFARQMGRDVEGLTRPAAEKLLAYSWPGNIRELRNVIQRAVALSATNQIGVEDLPEKIVEHRPSDVFIGGEDPSDLVPLEQIERRYIDHVLHATSGNRTKAAEILGLDRKTLYRRLKAREDSGDG